ncbi:MAG TPA: asparagine synthase (glutamine-hydrolyzing) [Pyrinomonadaceae bacterium]
MCSISGIISISTRSTRDDFHPRAVKRMNAALRHRGPDDDGVVQFEGIAGEKHIEVCLGNTRLAIIDTSVAGHQPMNDPQSKNWLTYNGETYNFAELKNEIGESCGEWSSQTDTEVVLKGYLKWGSDVFARLRGMFALALWDAQQNKLLLVRDQFGIKPLYYYREETPSELKIVFASEVRALLASGMVPRKLDAAGVSSYLEFGSVQDPLTIIDGVKSLESGSVFEISSQGTRVSRFSSGSRSSFPTTRSAAVKELRGVLEESVKAHLVSDVPLGIFLSGGMDSSALVALMSRVSTERPKTFSVVFDEAEFTEEIHSRTIANKFDTDHSEIRLSQQRLLEMLPASLSALDQPSIDGPNSFVISQAVKEAGITVALSGLGGDELFAGYPSFRRAKKVSSISAFARTVLRSAAPVGRQFINSSVSRKKFWQLAASGGSAEEVYRITRQLFSDDDAKELFERWLSSPEQRQIAGDVINRISLLEIDGYMANTLLRDTDSMSMANSLEVRVPFVDRDVAEFVLALPGDWKLNGDRSGVPKKLLADAISDLIAPELFTRPKMGFTLPFEKWLHSSLKSELDHLFSNPELVKTIGLNLEPVQQLWKRFLETPKSVGWSRPWSLYVLGRWCELHEVSLA